MLDRPSQDRHRAIDFLGLLLCIGLCLGVAALGGAVTATSVGSWYQSLQKPSFNPPDWLFAPVWTTLYLLMAVAAWRVWRRAGFTMGRNALLLFVAQLGLNLAWSYLFFGLRRIDLALLEIIILLMAIALNAALFWRIDRWAGALFLPYIAWVAFAAVLNGALWRLN